MVKLYSLIHLIEERQCGTKCPSCLRKQQSGREQDSGCIVIEIAYKFTLNSAVVHLFQKFVFQKVLLTFKKNKQTNKQTNKKAPVALKTFLYFFLDNISEENLHKFAFNHLQSVN